MSHIDIRDNFTPKVLARTFGSDSRRPRFHRVPTKERVNITEADIDDYVIPISVHGPLHMEYFDALSKNKHRSIERHRQRGKQLFHEDNTYISDVYWGNWLLSRPLSQKRLIKEQNDKVVYGLTDATKNLLKRRGVPCLVQPSHFDHQYMGACCTASVAIEAKGAYKNHLETIGNRPLEFDVGSEKLEPDALLSLTHSERVIYFVEIDRSTEPLLSDTDRKTIEGMFTKYINFIGRRWYKTSLDTGDTARLLFITNTKGRMESVMALLSNMTKGKGSKHTLFNYVPHFGKHFQTPPVLSYLYTSPWERVGYEPLFINE